MSDTNRTTDITLQISSVFDNTGTSTAQQELGKTADAASRIASAADPDALKKSLEDMNGELRATRLFLKDLQDGWEGFFNGMRQWLGYFGKATGAVTLLTVGIRTLKGVYDFFTADSRKAHTAQLEAIKKATEAAAKMKKELAAAVEESKDLANAQITENQISGVVETYQRWTAEIQQQLEIERKRAAIHAKIKGFEAQAAKYELDNKLDRGEIGINEHREQSRILEDQAREERYAAEVKDATKEMENLREQTRLASEGLKTLQEKSDELNKGEGIVLSGLDIKELDARKTANDQRMAELDKEIKDLEKRGLGWTLGTREKINEYNWYDRDNTAIAERKKASKDWLNEDGHGGTYDTWKTARAKAAEAVANANKNMNDSIKKTQELKATIEGLGEAKIAEEGMVARNRANEDATNETKDFRAMPVKQAVEQLTKEKTDLAEAAKLLQESAKSDAAALADASEGVTSAATAAKSFGDVGLGKEVQDFMAGLQKTLKSSSDLAGKGDKIADMSKTLQDLLKKGVFDAKQSNDLQETIRVLTNMAENQTAQKANADKTAELDKKIADLNNIDTARRNIAEDTAAYERMADSLTRQAEEQAAKNEGDAAAQAALKTAIKTLADKTVTPDELPALLEAQESLNGATDAASVKTRELLNLIITGLGTAAGRLNKQSADLEANKTEVNRINASLAYPSK